jgi:hypothetical protein
MIVYDLLCAKRHSFEGWFSSAEDFARQREALLVRCPICEDVAVERRPSAQVRVGQAAPPQKAVERADTDNTPRPVVAGDGEVMQLLRRLVSDTENVGRAFAEEARKIHYEEAPKRGIRGQATPDEAEELRDEGIDFMSLPHFLTRDLH